MRRGGEKGGEEGGEKVVRRGGEDYRVCLIKSWGKCWMTGWLYGTYTISKLRVTNLFLKVPSYSL